MNKLVTYLFCAFALLVTIGTHAPAMASFDDASGTLIVNVYNASSETGDTELGFDTGISLKDVDWTAGGFSQTYQLDIDVNEFAAGTTLADLRLGIHGFVATSADGLYGYYYYISTDPTSVTNATQFTSFRNSQQIVKREYRVADTDGDGKAGLENNITVLKSYDNKLNNVTDISGYYGGLNPTPTTGEADLAVWGDADGSNGLITLYLIGLFKTGPSPSPAFTTQLGAVATITIDKTGLLTVSNAAPTDPCENLGGDSDGDGVCTDNDKCPNSAAGVAVDSSGCAEGQQDSDGDGVPDSEDQCPGRNDVHSDSDGVADCVDEDDDDDGMPDTCETLWGLDPLSANENQASPGNLDGDGYSNAQECAAGSNPNDADANNPGAIPGLPVINTVTHQPESLAVQEGQQITITIEEVLPASEESNRRISSYQWTFSYAGEWTQQPQNPTTASVTMTAPSDLGQNDAPKPLAVTVSAIDALDIASTAYSLTFTVSPTSGNTRPTATGLHAPAISSRAEFQVATLSPTLEVNNAGDDDGDSISLLFLVAEASDALNETDALAAQYVEQSGTGTTAWSYTGPQLEEDTQYYWQSFALQQETCVDDFSADPLGCNSAPMSEPPAYFFVNTQNAPPNAPNPVSPADNSVAVLQGLQFVVDLNPYALNESTDYYDIHTYELQITNAGDTAFASPLFSGDLGWNRFTCQAGTSCKDNPQWPIELPSQAASELVDNQTYQWRLVYWDDGGGIHQNLESSTDAFTFTINFKEDAPVIPTGMAPMDGDKVSQLPVTLYFLNNGDPDTADEALSFTIELATAAGDAFDDTIVHTIDDAGIHHDAADAAENSLQADVDGLTEDQTYYWRVRVSDGTEITKSNIQQFLFNEFNEPPGAPQAVNPPDGEVWDALTPVFKVSVAGDTEGEPVYCRFEIRTADNQLHASSGDVLVTGSQDPEQAISRTYSCTWTLTSPPLENDTTYYWQVTAYDSPNREDSATAQTLSDTFSFKTSVNFYQPTAPTLNNPYSGGTVRDLKPTLSIFRSEDEDNDDLTYTFELYACVNLSCRTVPLDAPVVGEKLVTATPLSALQEGTTYYWRARVTDLTDERHSSSWMPTASFTVNSEGPALPYEVAIDLSEVAYFDYDDPTNGQGDPDIQKFTVTHSDAGYLVGLQVLIPNGAITEQTGNINLQVGRGTRVPALPVDMAAVGTVAFLAPEGFQFAQPVTVRIPIVAPGTDNPAGIVILTYDTDSGEWVQVPAALSEDGQYMVFETTHFSLYTMAMEDTSVLPQDDTDIPAAAGGGGSSGCFIGSLY